MNPVLRNSLRVVVSLIISLIRDRVLPRIPFESAREFLSYHSKCIAEVVEVFLDENPNNAEQLETLWKAKQEALIEGGLEQAALIVEAKVQNKELAKHLAAVLRSIDIDGDDLQFTELEPVA